MDKIREDFEKWALDNNWFLGRDGEVYRNTYVGAAFEAWQASRAALVVELPETCCRALIFEQDNTLEVGMKHGEYYEPDDIHSALDKAGVKYE